MVAFALAALIAVLSTGCVATRQPAADPRLLDFLQDGQTSKEAVLLKLGQPSALLEGGRILTFRLGHEKKRGYFLREAGVTDWLSLRYSLVLVFDDQQVLRRHALVEVR